LLLIGTNDFGQDFDTVHAIDRLDNLITKIATERPDAHLLVSNLLLRTDSALLEARIEAQFNPFVPGLVAAHQLLGQRVTFLDLHSLLTAADLADGLHPNQVGYDKLGDAWFQVIQAIAAPEPSSIVLLCLGASAVAVYRCRRRKV